MTHPENTTPANPAQGVIGRMKRDFAAWLKDQDGAVSLYQAYHAGRTAAIGAGDEWQDVLSRGMPFGFDLATGYFHADDGGAPSSCIFYVPKEDAIGAGGQAVAARCALEEQRRGS